MELTLSVIHAAQSKRYRVALNGDVRHVTIHRIKKHLQRTTGIAIDDQRLLLDGAVLHDDTKIVDVPYTGKSFYLEERSGHSLSGKDVGLFGKGDAAKVTLEHISAQRGVIVDNLRRKDDDYARRQQELMRSVRDLEIRRSELEEERRRKEQDLERMKQAELQAIEEEKALKKAQQAEQEREKRHLQDLASRKERVEKELAEQQELEFLAFENERKKIMLEQRRTELEEEKEQLRQAREERFERQRQHELAIRERELELYRMKVEAEDSMKDLQLEKRIALEQRELEQLRLRGGSAVSQEVTSTQEPHLPSKMEPSDAQSAQRRFFTDPNSVAPQSPPPPTYIATAEDHTSPVVQDTYQAAEAMLRHFANELGVGELKFDASHTCVVGIEDKFTVLITFDPATDRLYVYATLLSSLPKSTAARLKLYEFLLEGALLGRDVCGGGFGVSTKNDFVLLSTSINVPQSSVTALSAVAPPFVETLSKWQARIGGILDTAVDDQHTRSSTTYHDEPPATEELRTEHTASEKRHGSDNTVVPQQVTHVPQSQTPARATPTPSNPSVQSQQTSRQPSRRGSVRPVIGLEVTDGVTVDGTFSKFADGLAVVNVKGPAQSAGILPNDHVKAVNGTTVTSMFQFSDLIQALKPGIVVPFVIVRSGKQITIDVRVGSAPVENN